MIIKTANTILYCNRWKETVSFYRDCLKFPIKFSNDWFVEFSLNETSRLSVANEKRSSVKSSGGKGITIALEIDDIDMVYSYLKEAGLKTTSVKNHAWGARVLYLYDPEGNRIEFWTSSK